MLRKARINPKLSWENIRLPEKQTTQLKRICNQIKSYKQSPPSTSSSRKKGINLLFTGPSGTGKTLAAKILSSDLNRDLYKVNLSTITSKYIGETEKNLARVLSKAEELDVVLLLDEADALLGKRSNVKDSHDRHANMEVNYLLQRLENHTGVVILSTNLREDAAPALLERTHCVIEFPIVKRALRKK